MKIKLDENMPNEAALFFRNAGFDVSTTGEQRLQGAPDEAIHAVGRNERPTLVTPDVDFANVLAYPPNRSSGIVVLRLKQQGRTAVLRALRPVLSLLCEESIDGRLWIVDEQRIRIRS